MTHAPSPHRTPPSCAPIPVDAPAAAAFPGVQVLATTVEVAAGGPSAEETERLWLAQHEIWHGRSRGDIRRHPRVAAYRALSTAIGLDPDRHPPSIQALVDRGLRAKPPGSWPHVNPVVDAVNAVAVADLAALGVFDAEKVAGPVRLTLSQGDEDFLALGADDAVRLDPGRLVLADDERVLSLFAHRDGVHQRVTGDTRRVVLLGCLAPGIEAGDVAAALVRAAGLLGGTAA